MGDPNASIPTPQPVIARPMFGSFISVLNQNCLAFISDVSKPTVQKYGLKKRLVPVKGCRKVKKADMKLNSYCPKISVDPETYVVTCDGKKLQSKAAETMAMTQSVFLM